MCGLTGICRWGVRGVGAGCESSLLCGMCSVGGADHPVHQYGAIP